jgi:hypothetical protein
MSDPAALEQQVQRLGTLLMLGQRARAAASAQEFAFVAVNQTHELLSYQQAMLWEEAAGRVAAVSSVAIPEPASPFSLWTARLCRFLSAKGQAQALTAADLPPELGGEWAEWLPAHAAWIPLTAQSRLLGGLLLARDDEFASAELTLLGVLAEAYGAAWAAHRPKARWSWRLKRSGRRRLAVAAAVLLGLLFPLHESVLASAEIVPKGAAVIRAPMEGVIDRFAVTPNQPVKQGDLLLALDGEELRNRLAVARTILGAADAELRQASQLAVFDPRAKNRLFFLQAKIEEHSQELAHAQSLLDRVELRAPHDGVAVFADINDWIGRPVATGERILTLADPEQVELEIHLPADDAIVLDPGAGILAYRLKADLAPGRPKPRIGLRGTAKIYGARVPLGYYLLRRPLAALRTRLGL